MEAELIQCYSIYGWGWQFDSSGVSVIHPSAWKGDSPKLAVTAFWEVRADSPSDPP